MKIKIPGTKSLANRALLLAALARGTSNIKNVPPGEDVDLMLQALQNLGAKISKKGTTVQITAPEKLQVLKKTFYTGNAGTVTRFLAAVLCFASQESIIQVSPEMEKRPIRELVNALRQLGANIEYLKKEGFPPLKIRPIEKANRKIQLHANTSSQYLSAILIATPLAGQTITIEVKSLSSKPYVNMTLQLMKKFSVMIDQKNYSKFTVHPIKYKKTNYAIESDCVAASYFAGLAFVHGQSASFDIPKKTTQGESAFFDKLPLLCKGEARTIDCNTFPDSALTLAILAALSPGTTKLTRIGHLRAKETDRLAALETELKKLKIQVKSTADSLIVKGNPQLQIHSPVLINTYNDHRIAMCFAILKSRFPLIEIENPDCVQKSYPKFWEDYKTFLLQTKRNYVLTGMRGSGKTTIGKKLAPLLKCKFLDLDELLTKKFKTSINNFVQKNGWNKFRTQEQNMIKKISQKKGYVIAMGGGSIINQENEKELKKNSIIIFLDCPIEVLKKRIENDPKTIHDRPPLKDLKSLYEERKKRYHASADLIINSEYENEKTILEKLFPSI